MGNKIFTFQGYGANLPGQSLVELITIDGKQYTLRGSCATEAQASMDRNMPHIIFSLPGMKCFIVGPCEITIPRYVGRYGQTNPRWANLEYAGGVTFGKAGCYTVAVSNLLVYLIGCQDEPPEVARKLREVGCYSGALLNRPDRIPLAYPETRYDGPVDVSKDGELRWHNTKANMERVWKELKKGPIIAEVDFRPTTREFDQHFIVLESPDESKGFKDIIIVDSLDGWRGSLMERYALVWYARDREPLLENAICGLRLLRRKAD